MKSTLIFIPYVKRKLDINQGDIFNSEYSFIKQGNISTDFNNEIKNYPIFLKIFINLIGKQTQRNYNLVQKSNQHNHNHDYRKKENK